MSKFIKSVAAAAVLATSATGTQAATLSTDVDVSLPSIIALYCYDAVTVNVTAAGLTAALDGEPTTAGLGSATVSEFTGELGASSNGAIGAIDPNVDLQLNNVCAFRALVGAAGVSVAVTQVNGTTLSHASDPAASIGAAGASLTTPATVNTGLGLAAAPTPVSVKIPLDLTNATAPGVYSKEELFTVTVSAL